MKIETYLDALKICLGRCDAIFVESNMDTIDDASDWECRKLRQRNVFLAKIRKYVEDNKPSVTKDGDLLVMIAPV